MSYTPPTPIARIFIFLTILITQAMSVNAGTTSSGAVLRINVGGHDYVDHNGNLWSSDAGYNTGFVATAGVQIYGTNDPVLHQTMRWDPSQEPELTYRFLLPNGNYSVNLYMAETAAQAVGQRSFDIYIEGNVVHEAVDIYAQSGGYGNALVKTAFVTVADGELNLDFVHRGGDPVINAIEVVPATSVAPNPDEQLPLLAQATGTNQIHISWDSFHNASDPPVAGYSVYRDDVEIATTNLTSYTDTGLSANTYYNYSVTSRGDDGNIIATSNTLTVTTLVQYDADLAPEITGTPPDSVTANTKYVFQPVAADNHGDTLTYSISNKPCWASFDSLTGQLSGTPGDGDIGTFDNIVITVTDGLHSVSLPSFSMHVLKGTSAADQATTGSLTLNWMAPKSRTDGTVLTQAEIGGYRIYYGESIGHYPYMVDVADETTGTFTITDVPIGTYDVAMTTYDIDGRESGFSSIISKTIR